MCHIWKRTKHCWLCSPFCCLRGALCFNKNGNQGEISEIFSSVAIMFFSPSCCHPNPTETTTYSPLHRWAPIHNRARTISRPWLESFPLKIRVIVGAGVAMETVVIVAIGVLATIFLASFIALVMVCRHRYCHPHDLLHHFDSKSVNQNKESKSVSVQMYCNV